MSRGLRPVLFVLFLAAAVSASAGPDDLFDAGAPGALQPGQQETILALENGRYTLQEGHFLDARPSDPARAMLTNARVAELLAGAPGGSAPSPSAAAGDAAYQRALHRMPKGTPANLNFDGGAGHAGDIRGPPGTGSNNGSTGMPDPAVLQAQIVQRLVFKGNKQDREAIGEAVATILKTKTGRRLAQEFVNEGASAEISVAGTDNAGETDTSVNPPKVKLSRKYLGTEPDYSKVAMAGTLAHELFGHAFEAQRAKKAGFSETAHDHYRGDEVGARLIDWLVQTELTGKVADADPKPYLTNPEAYYRDLVTHDAYYAGTLSPREMKNPVAALKGRRKLFAEDAAKTAADIKETAAWTPIIAHFVKVHRIAKARFAPAEKEVADYLSWAATHQKKLVEGKEYLEGKIKRWSSPEGAKEKKELIDSADSPYLKGQEAALAARARELRHLRANPNLGRGPASETEITLPGMVISVTESGPGIDLTELSDMYANDQEKHPGHWK
jgi:hypothetical protein